MIIKAKPVEQRRFSEEVSKLTGIPQADVHETVYQWPGNIRGICLAMIKAAYDQGKKSRSTTRKKK